MPDSDAELALILGDLNVSICPGHTEDPSETTSATTKATISSASNPAPGMNCETSVTIGQPKSDSDGHCSVVASASPPTPLPPPLASDKLIVEASNGIQFQVSRTNLMRHSPFFAALLSLPTPTGDLAPLDEPEIIQLPSASSAGLALIIAIIERSSNDAQPGAGGFSSAAYRYWMSIESSDLRVVAEAAICADAYDLTSIFEKSFAVPVLARLEHQPIIRFAFAAVTRTAIDEISLVREMILNSSTNRPEVPSDIQAMLGMYAPDKLNRLLDVFRRQPTAFHKLQCELRSTVPMANNEPNGYALRCSGQKRG